jgi:hypothetical protein
MKAIPRSARNRRPVLRADSGSRQKKVPCPLSLGGRRASLGAPVGEVRATGQKTPAKVIGVTVAAAPEA